MRYNFLLLMLPFLFSCGENKNGNNYALSNIKDLTLPFSINQSFEA